jgi:O-antigen/teichoic acid export membrane protein
MRERARAALVGGGAFTLFRDAAQFSAMIVLVRLLSPQDYGQAALAQSVLGFLAAFSFNTFGAHVYQFRDPGQIDWRAHFSAAAVVNSILMVACWIIAVVLSVTKTYQDLALPLVGMSSVFIVEIAGTLRIRMLEVNHEWLRFRLLLILGTLLSLGVGLLVAVAGGGVWALVVQVPLFGLPAAVDLFWEGGWRPGWHWSWRGYQNTVYFGLQRAGAAMTGQTRQTIEQALLAGTYDFAALGIFTRSVGLATLVAGRLGSVATGALYPVITRAEQRSPQLQRYTSLVLRGVAWATVAAAAFLALTASDVTTLLYGERWTAVVPLLPWAVAGVALLGIGSAANTLLLANNEGRLCLVVDAVSAAIGIALALVFVQRGIELYLAALAGHGAFVLALTLWLLWAKRGIATDGIVAALIPAAVAGAAGAGTVAFVREVLASQMLVLRLGLEFALFILIYVAVLRVLFKSSLGELLDVVPGGEQLARLVGLGNKAVLDT